MPITAYTLTIEIMLWMLCCDAPDSARLNVLNEQQIPPLHQAQDPRGPVGRHLRRIADVYQQFLVE